MLLLYSVWHTAHNLILGVRRKIICIYSYLQAIIQSALKIILLHIHSYVINLLGRK
jgi:hypothetical protein